MQAARALGKLAINCDNQVNIAREGGIPPLISLLRDGSAKEKTEAASSLENLAANAGIAGDIVRLGGLSSLIVLVSEGSAEGKALRRFVGCAEYADLILKEGGAALLTLLLSEVSDS